MKDGVRRKRERYEEFLKSVSLFSNMDSYERSKLAEAFREHDFAQGQCVIREGEPGDSFYIVLEGEAVATKVLKAGQAPSEVKRYKPGEYFGEIAILKNVPRAASVTATSADGLRLVSLDRACFKRLLGPLDDILKRNMDSYLQHVLK